MQFTDNNKVVHRLPKLTPALNRRIQEVGTAKTDDDTCRAMYDIMVELMGEESAAKAFDATDYEDCDVMAVSLCFTRMCRAYQQPLMDEQAQQAAQAINKLPVEKLTALNSIVQG